MLPGVSGVPGEPAPAETTELVEALFSRSPIGVLSLDFEGRLLRVNESFARIVATSIDALQGTAIAAHQPPGEASALQAALEEARSGVVPAPFEARFRRADGSLATCRLTVGAVRDAGGRCAYALASVEDLSTTVAAEVTLRESEERFRTLFEVSPDGVLMFVGGVVQHANRAALTLLGAEHLAQLVGRKSTELMHPSNIPLVEKRAAALMAGEVVPVIDEKYVRLDGEIVDVEVSAARVPLSQGKAFVVIMRDVRDRKESEERARKEREAHAASIEARERELWLREIIDLLPTCVYARDDGGVFVLANRALSDLMGLAPRDIVGRTLEQLGVPADVAAASLERDRIVLETKRPTLVNDEAFVDRAGRRRIFESSRLPFSVRGRATVLCAATDVTERQRLEAELLEAQKLEAIGRLAGGIAHDFNNLLTVLVASAEELMAQKAAPDADLARILSVASRATALTQQLLDFARKSPVDVRELRLNDLVGDIVSLLARVLGEEITIVMVLDPAAGSVRVDRGSMDRVLMNLAVNARDAMPGGGTLTFSTSPVSAPDGGAERWVALSVHDTGHGMSEETRAHLFEPFYTTKSTGEGTGLGLATSFGIVQQAGGRIEVSSELGQGTTFRILLPTTGAAPEPRAPTKPPASVPLGTETILLLDDDPFVRSATMRTLKRLGYDVVAASTPEEAIAIARTHARIDLLLTDVVMPGMSGPQTASAIREVLAELPVLYVSGYSRDALAFAGDTVHVLPKPFSRSDLARKLRLVLDAARPERSG
ncbi:MAG TPA: PAS domain S-box protein [Labilithrix sp.]|nr:PAS domain S-box protein [Labilithrix sp.]